MRDILLKIIESKFNELNKYKQSGIFDKIQYFEGNAIGQIGEKFIKEIFIYNIPFDNVEKETIHDELDLLSNGKKIEIKVGLHCQFVHMQK